MKLRFIKTSLTEADINAGNRDKTVAKICKSVEDSLVTGTNYKVTSQPKGFFLLNGSKVFARFNFKFDFEAKEFSFEVISADNMHSLNGFDYENTKVSFDDLNTLSDKLSEAITAVKNQIVMQDDLSEFKDPSLGNGFFSKIKSFFDKAAATRQDNKDAKVIMKSVTETIMNTLNADEVFKNGKITSSEKDNIYTVEIGFNYIFGLSFKADPADLKNVICDKFYNIAYPEGKECKVKNYLKVLKVVNEKLGGNVFKLEGLDDFIDNPPAAEETEQKTPDDNADTINQNQEQAGNNENNSEVNAETEQKNTEENGATEQTNQPPVEENPTKNFNYFKKQIRNGKVAKVNFDEFIKSMLGAEKKEANKQRIMTAITDLYKKQPPKA